MTGNRSPSLTAHESHIPVVYYSANHGCASFADFRARLLGRIYSLLSSDFYREKRSAGYIWCPDLRSQVFFSEARLKPNVKVSHRMAVSFTLRTERSSSTHGTSKV